MNKNLQTRKNNHMRLTHEICRFIIKNNREPSSGDNEELARFLRVRRDAKAKPGRRTWPECLEILREHGLGMLFDVAKYRPEVFPDRQLPGKSPEKLTSTKAEIKQQDTDLFQVTTVQNNHGFSRQVDLSNLSNLMTQITASMNFSQSFETLYLSRPAS
jgi:hypothetical protein